MRKQKLQKQKIRKQKMRQKEHSTRKTAKKSYRFGIVEQPGRLLKCKMLKIKCAQKVAAEKLCCPLCNLVFDSNKSGNLERHLKLHEETVQRYKCSSCGRTYSSSYNFKRHLPRRHEGEDVTNISWTLSPEGARVRPLYPQIV